MIAARATFLRHRAHHHVRGEQVRTLLRVVAVLFVAIAAFLVYAVIAAITSSGGAKPGVVIAYIIGAIVLVAAAVWMWRRPAAVSGSSV
jgi:hypothetical protein